MRTEYGARAAVRRSGVSLQDWARALGCSKQAVCKLAQGCSSMQNSPLMGRLQDLLDQLDAGHARWLRTPCSAKPGQFHHRLDTRLSFAPTRERRVDFLGMRLGHGVQS